MIRRRFLGLITLAGATGVGVISKAVQSAGERETVTYKVSGFTLHHVRHRLRDVAWPRERRSYGEGVLPGRHHYSELQRACHYGSGDPHCH